MEHGENVHVDDYNCCFLVLIKRTVTTSATVKAIILHQLSAREIKL